MIKIPKKQLSNLVLSTLFVSIALLIIFFVYSLKYNAAFFVVIIATQIILVIYFLLARSHLIQKQAEIDLMAQDYAEKTNLVQAEMADERFVVEAWQEKILNYLQLKDLTEKLSMCLSLTDTSKTLSLEAHKFLGETDATTILYLFDAQTGEPGIAAAHKGQTPVNIKSKKGDVFDRWVVKALQPLLIEDVKNDFRFDFERIATEEIRDIHSLISAPMIISNKLVGILRLDSAKENQFSTEDLRVLKTISDLGALAVENAQLYEKVEELAIRDSLTGLYLRRYLLDRLSEEISRQMRRKKPLSFLMIDLDRFKQYNDKYGHTAGDIVLKTISMILSESFLEPGNLVCRYGGEEFAILLPDCSKKEAIEIAEEIRKKISKQEIILRKKKTNITVSVGVATFPDDVQIKEELIHLADQAMYKAKSKGRNRICFF